MAPMIATPSEPPTWRMLFSTPDPTPALSTGTEPIAAAVVGVIAIAIPAPPTRRAGKRFQNDECWSSSEKRTSETLTSSMPPLISQRAPRRSDSFPATGAKKMMQSVIGRNDAPACTGE